MSAEILTKAKEIAKRWKNKPENIIEMMHDVQNEFNYLPKEILETLSKETTVPIARIYNIATFYNAFSLKPKGKHKICVCMGTPCHALGAPKVVSALERELKIKCGETTEDMQFSLDISGCVGTCGLAPVVIIGDELYGPVGIQGVPKLVNKYKNK
ncbi:MAG: NAD(P)H-dependent oxidoreductase subunit E [Ignavibacteria bacterium]|nr:NAD(P)H-dependent oxidoreductase subunit E [Ignavibacteria bacterium]